MINLFEIGINILEELTILVFLTLYFGNKYKGVKSVVSFTVGLIIAVIAITYLNSLYIYEAFLGVIFIFLYFLYCCVFLKGDIYTKLFISGFINCIVYSLALFSALCVSILFKDNAHQMYNMSTERIALIAISKSLLIIICIILLKFRFNYVAKKNNMLLLIFMPIITELSTVGIMQVFLRHNELKSELFLASVSVMLTNILTYYAFIKINKDIQNETELIILHQKLENDKKNARDIEELYNKVCGTKHDLLIHFSTISRLLDESKEKAQEYIQTVTNNQLDTIKNLISTGNDCFDAIVNTKIALCEKYSISVRIRAMEKAIDNLPHDEIAILIGNLFDNAIEASKNSERKIIKLDVQIQDAYLSVCMKNSIDKSVLAENKKLYTTKENKHYHGFGTKNIKRIVEKHSGHLSYDEENGYFICDILLPI